MPKDYYGRGDYSDDDSMSRSRDRFRRERSPEKDDFGRDKRRRKASASPDDRERRPRRNRSPSKDGDSVEPGDRYIPNYERDGYNPAPRYSRPDHYGRHDPEYRGSRRRDDYGDLDGHDSPYGHGGPDMHHGWGGHNNNGGGGGGGGGGGFDRMDDPMKLDYMISFKHYCDYIRSLDRASHRYKRYTDEELQTRYSAYREEFTAKHLNAFFEAHKTEAWFQEKYHPELSKSRTEEAIALKQSLFDKFAIDLAAGKYDNATCDEVVAKKNAAAATEAKNSKSKAEGETSEAGNGETDKDGDVKVGGDDNSSPVWLYLRTILPNVTRDSLLERCKKVGGFMMLSLSEPHPLKDLQRIGWIKFKQGTDLQEALEKISDPATEDFQVSTADHRPTRARYTHEIANSDDRTEADYELAKTLVRVCDENLAKSEHSAEGGAEAMERDDDTGAGGGRYDGAALLEARLKDVILPTLDNKMDDGDQEEGALAPVKIVQVRRSLDLYIEYLRQVHLFCYYCGGDSDNVEEFARKCSRHFRNPDVKAPVNNTKGATWVKNLEQKLNLRIKPPTDEELVKLGGKSLEKNVLKFLQSKTQQDEPTKFRCKICTKPFRGDEFVHKHIRSKHPEEVKTLENNIQLFNNYVIDPNHINPAAQQQQPAQQPPGFGFGMGPGMYGGSGGHPPMPMGFMSGMMPMGMPPFMNPAASVGMPPFPPSMIPPSFSATGAVAGTPMDQIPRIGFDIAKRRGSKDEDRSRYGGMGSIGGAGGSRSDGAGSGSRPMMMDPR
ncbi:hypothetical protein BGW38_005521, partial [Lunasporangiospora selenospora]